MAIALVPLSHCFASFQALLAWLAPAPAPRRAVPRQLAAVPARCVPVRRAPVRPLRVVRVFEPEAPRAVAGRMVISGRLADVCAELERLAAQEAHQGCAPSR